MSLSAASAASSILLLHALFILTSTFLLAAMAMVVSTTTTSSTAASVVVPLPPVDDMMKNTTTTMFTASKASSAVGVPPHGEMYYCFLCTGRHPLLMHTCPIYWDECHLNCWFASAQASAPPAPPSSAADDDTVPGNLECYVMKLYNSGRYVIVERLDCAGVAPGACFLTCGGGELYDDHKVVATAAIHQQQQGSFALPRPPSEVCNSELLVNAPPSASAASGDAH